MTHTDPRAEQGALAVAWAARWAGQGSRPDAAAFVEEVTSIIPLHDGELLHALELVAASVQSGESTGDFAARIVHPQRVSAYINHTVPVVLHAWLRRILRTLRHRTARRHAKNRKDACRPPVCRDTAQPQVSKTPAGCSESPLGFGPWICGNRVRARPRRRHPDAAAASRARCGSRRGRARDATSSVWPSGLSPVLGRPSARPRDVLARQRTYSP